MRINTKVQLTSPLSKREINVISLRSGNTVVISTNYLRDKPTDRLIKAFSRMGECFRHKYKQYDKEGKLRIIV